MVIVILEACGLVAEQDFSIGPIRLALCFVELHQVASGLQFLEGLRYSLLGGSVDLVSPVSIPQISHHKKP